MKRYNVTVNGTVYEVEVEETDKANDVSVLELKNHKQADSVLAAESAAEPAAVRPGYGGGSNTVSAPMPGTVIDIKVSAGQKVAEGDTLLILEAMKMENEIAATVSGIVDRIPAVKGNTVNAGDPLVILK